MSILGVWLTIVTIRSSPTTARGVHTRLSVAGTVASHFEQQDQANGDVSVVEDLFEEKKGIRETVRVRFARTKQGGWNFQTFGGRE